MHFKGGFAKPVELKAYRPGVEYRLGDMVEAVEDMPAMPGLPPAVGNGELVVKPLSYVLADPGGVDGITRHDALTRVIGYFVRRYHEGHITEKAMWDEIIDYNNACVRPPWDNEKVARDTNALLKRDAEKRKARDEEAEREEKKEKEKSGRTSFPVPHPSDELTPVMRLLDEQLSTDEPEPPMRSLMGWPVEVRLCEPTGLHELTADSVNDEAEDNSRLPAPKIPMLAPHDGTSMTLLIEEYVCFYKEVKNKGKEGGKKQSPYKTAVWLCH